MSFGICDIIFFQNISNLFALSEIKGPMESGLDFNPRKLYLKY